MRVGPTRAESGIVGFGRSPGWDLDAHDVIAPSAVYVPKDTVDGHSEANMAFRLVQARPLGPDELGDEDRRALRAPSQRGPEYRREEHGRVVARDKPAARCRV